MTKKFITHQGDIPIYEVEGFEGIFKSVESQIVALGEVTGHHHKIVKDRPDTSLEVAFDGTGYYLRSINGDALLTHQEHGIQVLPQGKIYYFGRQSEYDPIEYRRKVQD